MTGVTKMRGAHARTKMRGILLRVNLLKCAAKFSRILRAIALKSAQRNGKMRVNALKCAHVKGKMRVNALKCAQKLYNVIFEITH